jgi:hypothetical protein
VVRRESDRARIFTEVVETERTGVTNENPEDAAAARKVADRCVRGGVDPMLMKRSNAVPARSITPSAA